MSIFTKSHLKNVRQSTETLKAFSLAQYLTLSPTVSGNYVFLGNRLLATR